MTIIRYKNLFIRPFLCDDNTPIVRISAGQVYNPIWTPSQISEIQLCVTLHSGDPGDVS